MPIEKMTKESEQRLLGALEKIADLTNDGAEPNAVIAKIASTMHVPAGHIPRLVNAYNSGRTTVQRQLGEDHWEKSAAFPLASADDVLSRMYPDTPKTARQIRREEVISSDYAASPMSWVSKLDQAEKTAWAKEIPLPSLGPVEKTAVYIDEDLVIRRKKGDVERFEKAATEAKYRFNVANRLAADLMDQFTQAFHEPGAPAFSQVKDACVRRFGDEMKKIFDYLEREYDGLPKLNKSAKIALARGPIYDLAERCLEIKQAFETLLADWKEKDAQFKEARELYLRFLGKTDPPKPVHPILGCELDSEVKTAAGFLTGLASVPTQMFSSGAGEIAKARTKALGEASIPKPKQDMGLENEMGQLQKKTVLQDLLSNDEVISGHDPHQVLAAYKEVADVAPMAAQRSAIAKDFVRRRLSGGQLNYFDLEALTRLEKNLNSIQQGTSSHESVLG